MRALYQERGSSDREEEEEEEESEDYLERFKSTMSGMFTTKKPNDL